MTAEAQSTTHRWRFFRAGGLDQVRFETAEDYRDLELLDPKLWVALACPVKGLEFDERTLALIDTDGDGRVRVPEVVNAVQWAEDHLKDLGALRQASETLPLVQINDQTPSGKTILASARQILKNLGRPEATGITLADVGDTAKIFAQTKFNGDGIIPADASADAETQKIIGEIITVLGPVADRSGKPGVSQAKTDAFFTQLTAFDAWARAGETNPDVKPLGDATVQAVDAIRTVRTKVDDFFARCRLAAFDPRSLVALNRKEEEFLVVGSKDLSFSAKEVAGFPIARIEANRALPLGEAINPAWAPGIAAFATHVVAPLLGAGRSLLSEPEWVDLKARLAPHEGWASSKPPVPVEILGLARVREILASPAQAEITRLITEDKSLEAESGAIANVERLIRYHRDLHRLLNNFVSFSDFYDPEARSTFQVGTLYLDARACELCVRVDDAGKHAALAGLAKTYLAYCDCTRTGGEKMTIAAALTDGDGDNLMVGRNGVFYDHKGRDWDATITKIVENPISIRQAFWAPYKKLIRMIEEQVAKRAAAAEAVASEKLTVAASAAANVDKVKPHEAKKIDVGTVAALGVALGAIGTAFATLAGCLTGILELPFWKASLACIGILFLVSGPSMLIAWLKLRQRNLGPILDANGWAVNGRVTVPVPLGRSLTTIAKLPPGTLPALDDKFAEPPSSWPKFLGFVVAICFVYSVLNDVGLIYRWSKGDWGNDPRKREQEEKTRKKATEPATNAAPAADAAPPVPAAAAAK